MIERMPERPAINLETLLDQGPWNMRRKSVMLMVALAVVFDGFDTALLGLAVPMISAELQIDLGAFAFIFAMGLAGMSIGTVAGGILGDRIGRRRMVIASVLMFSIPTIAIAWSTGIETFALLRLLAGFGLGSLLPNGGALVAEFTPARWRSMAVMLTMMCIAVGSVIAGILSSGLLDLMGWRGLFVIGGIVPMGYALLLLYALPESPRFLVRRPGNTPQLASTLSRMGLIANPDVQFVEPEDVVEKASVRAVLQPAYLWDCLTLSGAFFFCMLCSYSFNSWLPAILAEAGIPPARIGFVTATFHLGSIIGIPIGSVLMMRIGSRRLLSGLSAGAAIAATILMAAKFWVSFSIVALCALLAIEAAMIAIVQVALYSVAVHIFPVPVRTTGIGLAVGLGRLGALASAFAAAAALHAGGAPGFFLLIASVMAMTTIFLLLIRKHIPAQ